MREIKFRAFSKVAQQIINWEKIKEKRNLHRLIKNSEYYLMQYTGLKDKNDVEIYEGDICLIENCFINFKDKLYSYIGEVKYTACRFMVVDEYLNSLSPFEYKNSIKVIGNIYENPELLEQE
ncbi:YopX family protein [Aliarcobacter butzleri]